MVALQGAAEAYSQVQARLKALRDLFPFRHGVEGNVRSAEGAALMREAALRRLAEELPA